MKNKERSTRYEEWASLIEEQKARGLSRKEFCKIRELPLSTFNYYCSRLKEELTPEIPLASFAPISVQDNTPTIKSPSELRLQFPNGLQCFIPNDLSSLDIKRLVGALLSC